jgi:hypothetical protein
MNFNINETFVGLRTIQLACLTPGPTVIVGKLSLPKVSQGDSGASTCVVTVNQNGTPIYTGNPGADGFRTGVTTLPGDIVTITTSSSSPVDQQLNAVKMTLSLWQGGE